MDYNGSSNLQHHQQVDKRSDQVTDSTALLYLAENDIGLNDHNQSSIMMQRHQFILTLVTQLKVFSIELARTSCMSCVKC